MPSPFLTLKRKASPSPVQTTSNRFQNVCPKDLGNDRPFSLTSLSLPQRYIFHLLDGESVFKSQLKYGVFLMGFSRRDILRFAIVCLCIKTLDFLGGLQSITWAHPA